MLPRLMLPRAGLLRVGLMALTIAMATAGDALADPTTTDGGTVVVNGKPASSAAKAVGPLNERDLVNQPVVNFENRDVANVTMVTTTPDQGRVAVLAVGGVLGFGRKEVAVPLSSLEVDPRGRILINASEDELEAKPAFRSTGG
ncbi:MAG: PRC-barrel domain-containing protein [Rhodospirillales bacterium]